MDEDFYTEWAEEELIWGKGMYNWCRAYSQEEWEKESVDICDYSIEIPFK